MKSFANIFVKMISQAWNLSPHRIEEFTYKITIDDLSDNKKKTICKVDWKQERNFFY